MAALAGCGAQSEAVEVDQPPGCTRALERTELAPVADDIVAGDAVLGYLRASQRTPWRELWIPRERAAWVKLPITVPAGGTLVLSVPPEARRIVALDYGGDPNRMTFTACHGDSPAVFFPGRLVVTRRICGVPLDWRYGAERGRVRLSFGDCS